MNYVLCNIKVQIETAFKLILIIMKIIFKEIIILQLNMLKPVWNQTKQTNEKVRSMMNFHSISRLNMSTLA